MSHHTSNSVLPDAHRTGPPSSMAHGDSRDEGGGEEHTNPGQLPLSVCWAIPLLPLLFHSHPEV